MTRGEPSDEGRLERNDIIQRKMRMQELIPRLRKLQTMKIKKTRVMMPKKERTMPKNKRMMRPERKTG